jgi:hypothetical protein
MSAVRSAGSLTALTGFRSTGWDEAPEAALSLFFDSDMNPTPENDKPNTLMRVFRRGSLTGIKQPRIWAASSFENTDLEL